MMIRGFTAFFLLFFSIVSVRAESVDVPPTAGAREQVEKLNAALIESMKQSAALGYRGRYKLLEPVVIEEFDFGSVAQIALGTHWKQLDAKQKVDFVEKLKELSIATYAAQFNAFDGEVFKYDSEQLLKPERLVLRYDMTSGDAKPVRFEYLLNLVNGHWKIINIVVDGISDLALKKAQYTSVMDREGFDSLLVKLSQKISDYAGAVSKP